jgi:hypothetical protein
MFADYTTDDGVLTCALLLAPDTVTVMGFVASVTGTPRAPQGLLTRKEVFINAGGKRLELPVPVASGALPLGGYYTIRGDPTYFAVRTVTEINRAEA